MEDGVGVGAEDGVGDRVVDGVGDEIEGIVGRIWVPKPFLAHTYFSSLVSILEKYVISLFSREKKWRDIFEDLS